MGAIIFSQEEEDIFFSYFQIVREIKYYNVEHEAMDEVFP